MGATIYYVLVKYWSFVKYPQAEIVNPSDDEYLGITAGRCWEIVMNEKPVEVMVTVSQE